MNAIWIAIASISVLGLVFGLILGYASRRFAVEDDPVVEKLMSCCHKASVDSVATLVAAPMQKRWVTAARRSTVAPLVARR